MKIALIGPGIMKIPPDGWGAVEIIIWDYYNELIKQNHEVNIINIPNVSDIINIIKNNNYDFIHIHYDVFYYIIPTIKKYCKNVAITSHYPYIDQKNKYFKDGFDKIFNFLKNNSDFYIFSFCEKDFKIFKNDCHNKTNIFFLENGIDTKKINFSVIPTKNKCLCLGKIEQRKRQSLIQNIDNIDFVGPICDNKFINKKNYLGLWTKDEVYCSMTNYENLILLSEGEGDPLVIKEAISAGLSIIVSENVGLIYSNLEFIDIIPNDKLNNVDYINDVIKKNATKNLNNRNNIRKYAQETFAIEIIVKKYITLIEKINKNNI